ncbi:hypothetical protein TWF730_003717 [Orbilia blumenaviensis]|uniref:Zn(2)-C6 fungal-type domain-containing protein n=1 Tax=Orbilia blumenaviensis TaxID=1796055 RepID=A0AAV9U5L5_9PEZI
MPPKSNTCSRCRLDRQGCVRDASDPYDPVTCNRCKRYKYTCTLRELTEEERSRESRILRFWKCSMCRDAHQKVVSAFVTWFIDEIHKEAVLIPVQCEPSENDQERCGRCVTRGLMCGPLTNIKQRPRGRGSGGGGGSPGESQGGNSPGGDSNSPDYDATAEDDPEDDLRGAGSYAGSYAGQQFVSQHRQYTFDPHPYGPPYSTNYEVEAYPQDACYSQSSSHFQNQPSYYSRY